MSLMDRMERRFGWMAFPGFLRFYVMLSALVFVLHIFRPEIGLLLDFDLGKILKGDVWRVFTFPFAAWGYPSDWSIPSRTLFLYFMVMIGFMMSDALEGVWGTFRASMYYYFGFICLVIVNVLFSLMFSIDIGNEKLLLPLLTTGGYIYTTAFFAFATLFPRVEFLIFFVLPVQVRFIALIMFVMTVADLADMYTAGIWFAPFFYILIFLNYVFWVGLPYLRGRKTIIRAAKRRRQFETSKQPDGMAFHECVVCSRTDQSHPGLEFRISADGKEYCVDHLPEGED